MRLFGYLLLAAGIVIAVLGVFMVRVALADDISVPCLDEITGEPGLQMASGECITPAEYDVIFGFENLDSIPSDLDPARSIADVAGLSPDVPASTRPLGEGLVATPFTFRSVIGLAHGIRIT